MPWLGTEGAEVAEEEAAAGAEAMAAAVGVVADQRTVRVDRSGGWAMVKTAPTAIMTAERGSPDPCPIMAPTRATTG